VRMLSSEPHHLLKYSQKPHRKLSGFAAAIRISHVAPVNQTKLVN
jgi:hypothetical protein